MHPTLSLNPVIVTDRWCVHSYYTLNPYAPDGSGRFLLAAADVKNEFAELLVLDANGQILDRFGHCPITQSFWHTGLWQCWSPDARYVYYQSGTLMHATVTRHDLQTNTSITMDGDMEGLPPSGEPGLSCSHAMLYAAGYGDRVYHPDQTPVPFQARDQHGITHLSFEPKCDKLIYTTQQMLDEHPCRDQLLAADREVKSRLGQDDGLTLMLYCVRWNRQGTRFLYYFGNHCVVGERGEPRIAYVMTADRSLKDIHMAVDLSFGKGGVHWGWCPDGEHLLGYGPSTDAGEQRCIATVHHTGENYRKLCTHGSGGHPTISPADPNLLVTDDYMGKVEFIDLKRDRTLLQVDFPTTGRIGKRLPGRHPNCIDTHPVFNHDGSKLLVNSLPDQLGMPVQLSVSGLF